MKEFDVAEVPVSTVMMCLLFGTNALLFLMFQVIKAYSKPAVEAQKGEKVLSKPFTGTVECFTNITTELFRTGLIVALTYICEKHWFFEHSGKSYSRDLFFFVLVLFFAYAFYTIKPINDLTLLGREQTEEWKGWMQFIFLLYHYFNASEVYNSVRVMITCYVWMTGFGNFSFFYIKQDFGWLRVVQMLWRLNFSVILLMWAHGNTYILYYICPMHTFYFLMVYSTMYVFSKWNTTKWGIRFKLLALAVFIYLVWDFDSGLFDTLFFWLGTDKVIGAKNGSLYEYYFRTSLDHWSTFLGMIFALNFPLAEQYFTTAKGLPLIIASLLMGALTVWWVVSCFALDKLEYNLSHAYFSIIPLTSYIFFRNCTPWIRSGVSMSLHDLGKTTLETYLLQHHIWLSSNAKTLLTVTPGYPWINFAVCTFAFFIIAKELYRLTMSLRGMVMPDDKEITWNNCVGMCIMLAVLYVVAVALYAIKPNVIDLCLTCIGLLLVTLLFISRFMKSCADNFLYQKWSLRALRLSTVILAVGTVLKVSIPDPVGRTVTSSLVADVKYAAPPADCLSAISKGQWTTKPCDNDHSRVVICDTDRWEWLGSDNPKCHLEKLNAQKMRWMFQGKKITFVGDSVLRNSYYQFISLLEPSYSHNHSSSLMHSNLEFFPSFDKNMSIRFIWAPFIKDVAAVMDAPRGESLHMLVAGVSFWDALHNKDVEKYRESLNKIAESHSSAPQDGAQVKLWLLPTTVQNDLLPTAEKQKYVSEEVIDTYRQAALDASDFKSLYSAVIDPTEVTRGNQVHCIDGLHYNDQVYTVIAHMFGNAYAMHFPDYKLATPAATGPQKPYVPKSTGGMSSPEHGSYVLILTVIMLFLMDSWLGIGFLSLALCGRGYDWDLAYSALHKKINAALSLKPRTPESSMETGEKQCLMEENKD